MAIDDRRALLGLMSEFINKPGNEGKNVRIVTPNKYKDFVEVELTYDDEEECTGRMFFMEPFGEGKAFVAIQYIHGNEIEFVALEIENFTLERYQKCAAVLDDMTSS